jgi:hypothetical protein
MLAEALSTTVPSLFGTSDGVPASSSTRGEGSSLDRLVREANDRGFAVTLTPLTRSAERPLPSRDEIGRRAKAIRDQQRQHGSRAVDLVREDRDR